MLRDVLIASPFTLSCVPFFIMSLLACWACYGLINYLNSISKVPKPAQFRVTFSQCFHYVILVCMTMTVIYAVGSNFIQANDQSIEKAVACIKQTQNKSVRYYAKKILSDRPVAAWRVEQLELYCKHKIEEDKQKAKLDGYLKQLK